jgi:hypothetical protein
VRNLKPIALFALLAGAAMLAVPAPEVSASRPASLAVPHPALSTAAPAAAPPMPMPAFCGDFCSVPGQTRGCIDDSSGVWKRVPCVCSGGVWVC